MVKGNKVNFVTENAFMKYQEIHFVLTEIGPELSFKGYSGPYEVQTCYSAGGPKLMDQLSARHAWGGSKPYEKKRRKVKKN
jgi:hypothetical protein